MRVLIVDDEETFRSVLKTFLEMQGHEVHTAAEGKEGMLLCSQYEFDIAVVDVFMPNLDGASLIRKLHEFSPNTQVIVITGMKHLNNQDLGITQTVESETLLEKPFQLSELSTLMNTPALSELPS